MAQGDPRMAGPARRPGRTLLGFPLTYWLIGGGAIAGFVVYRMAKGGGLGGIVGAKQPAASANPNAGTGLVPSAGYGSVNAPNSGGADWASVISQLAVLQGGGLGAGTGAGLPAGGVQGVTTNPPQVAYGPGQKITGGRDPITGQPIYSTKIGYTGPQDVPGAPTGYGGASGANQYTTSAGQIFSQLIGGNEFNSTLQACNELFWQPQPGTFVKYPTMRLPDRTCGRSGASPPLGTPVFVSGQGVSAG